MQPLKISPYTLIVFWTIAGFLLGLIPLFLGMNRKKSKYGVYALISSTIGGAVLGIYLIIPVIGVFIWLILKKPTQTDAAIENAAAVEIDNTENR